MNRKTVLKEIQKLLNKKSIKITEEEQILLQKTNFELNNYLSGVTALAIVEGDSEKKLITDLANKINPSGIVVCINQEDTKL